MWKRSELSAVRIGGSEASESLIRSILRAVYILPMREDFLASYDALFEKRSMGERVVSSGTGIRAPNNKCCCPPRARVLGNKPNLNILPTLICTVVLCREYDSRATVVIIMAAFTVIASRKQE